MSSLFFVTMHMQDIIPILAPVSLAVFIVSQAIRITIPKHLPRELLILLALWFYMLLNIWMNNSLSGIGVIDFVKQHGKIFYTIGLFPVFFFIHPLARLEEKFILAAILAAFFISILLIMSYLGYTGYLFGVKLTKSTGMLVGPLGGHGPTAASLSLSLIMFLTAVICVKERIAQPPVKLNVYTAMMILIIFIAFVLAKSRGRTLALVGVLILMSFTVFRGKKYDGRCHH